MEIKKNKNPIPSRKITDEGGQDSRDVVRAYFARQPREVKIAVCTILAMSDGDRGASDLAQEIVDGYEADLLTDAQDPRADMDPESRTMIGLWMGLQAVQGR
jgi:alkanesulfonate monooxygenase SsuD/methylene tetrahydromethanopterin reductase-like flavin-dependent oxidoreductase (luciferase family)